MGRSPLAAEAESAGLPRQTLAVVADGRNTHPALLQTAATTSYDLIETLEEIDAGVPVLGRLFPHRIGPFYRLHRHWRSFCYALDYTRKKLFDFDVVVFKGTEPLSPRFAEMIAWMQTSRPEKLVADHLVIVEGKVPGAVTLSEAVDDYRIGREIHRLHLCHYRELAALPLPLLALRLPEANSRACDRVLARSLSQEALGRAHELIAGGLACIIQYYPAVPIRANSFGGAEFEVLSRHLAAPPDTDATIRGWLRLFARLLWLGYLPTTPRSRQSGSCLNAQNATMGGGFSDPGSILRIDPSLSDVFVCASLSFSFDCIFDAITFALSRSSFGPKCPAPYKSLFLDAFEQFLGSEAISGQSLDPRIVKVLSERRRSQGSLVFGGTPPASSSKAR